MPTLHVLFDCALERVRDREREGVVRRSCVVNLSVCVCERERECVWWREKTCLVRSKEGREERERGSELIECKCAAVCIEQEKYCCQQHRQELSMAYPELNVTIFRGYQKSFKSFLSFDFLSSPSCDMV